MFRYIFLSLFALLLLTACGDSGTDTSSKDTNEVFGKATGAKASDNEAPIDQNVQQKYEDLLMSDPWPGANEMGQVFKAIGKDVSKFLRQSHPKSCPGCDLTGANLSRLSLTGVNLSGAILIGSDLSWSNLHGADLTGADLSRADLTHADLSYSYLNRANLSGADLSCDIGFLASPGVSEYSGSRGGLCRNLKGANLSEANLSGANLGKADMIRASLIDADLTGARMFLANLLGANLTGANLSNAEMWQVMANLADLTNANLTQADLFEANMNRANLTGANLTRADLSNAFFYEAIWSGTNVSGACTWDGEEPYGFGPEAYRGVLNYPENDRWECEE